MDSIEITQGVNKDVRFSLRDGNGQPVTDLPEDSTLTVVVWAGDDQAILTTPMASWSEDDPSTGIGIIHLTADDFQTLKPGFYRLLCTLDVDGSPTEALQAWLKLTPAPGSALSPRSYVTREQLLMVYPRLDDEQGENDQTGFAEERAQASRWLDQIILSKLRSGGERAYVKTLLDDDRLVVDQGVIQLTTSFSLALILGGRLTGTRGQSDPLPDLAKRFRIEAENLARSLTIFVEGFRPIDLGVIPVRRG